MKLKHLQSALSSIPTPQFPNPNITLEQYATSPNLCSYIILAALENDDIGYGKSVLDLGCGTGMLSIGCAIVGTTSMILVDCDDDAMTIARENLIAMEIIKDEDDEEYEIGEEGEGCAVEFLMAKLNHTKIQGAGNSGGGRGRGKGKGRGRGRGGRSGGRGNAPSSSSIPLDPPTTITPLDDGIPLSSNCVDTVMTNPPFGTKPGNAGIDISFLRTAIRLARTSVYSFHKSSTREYLIKTVSSWGPQYHVEVVAQMKFDIPKMYKFHKEDNVDVDVDLIRVVIVNNEVDDS